ncbi:hypothetical protein LUZ60_001685 [Juncus effusus]|nr:hypothetical protein LUZ60_001685 [Juncus effusus]
MKIYLATLVFACLISSTLVSAVRVPKEKKLAYIVFVDRPNGTNPDAFDYKILAEAVGSMEAAKKALIYHYDHPAFAAWLTHAQVEKLRKIPQVIDIITSVTYII